MTVLPSTVSLTIWSDSCATSTTGKKGSVWSISSPARSGRVIPAQIQGIYPKLIRRARLPWIAGRSISVRLGHGDVTVTWQQYESGTLESDDRLYYQFYGNGAWGGLNEALSAMTSVRHLSETNVFVPMDTLACRFQAEVLCYRVQRKQRYCYLDNVTLPALLCRRLGCRHGLAGSLWPVPRPITLPAQKRKPLPDIYQKTSISAQYAGQSLQLSWEQTEEGNLSGSDGLQFSDIRGWRPVLERVGKRLFGEQSRESVHPSNTF